VRRRRGLHKVWILALALLVALGAMGVTYGAWTDEIYIEEGTLSTSGINTTLACNGDCWVEVGDVVTQDTGTSINCTKVDPLMLTITITNALQDILVNNVPQGVDYYCNFIISNPAGSLPVKIQSISITDYAGVAEAIGPAELLSGDYQIDPEGTAPGTVHIYLTDTTQLNQNLTFTLEVTVKRWNE
jgi:hypothetical protein